MHLDLTSCKTNSSEAVRAIFGRPFVKRFALCYRTFVMSCPVCLSVCLGAYLSVCYVDVLWPNGWMDRDVNWQGDKPRPRRICVRRGPIPSPRRAGGRVHVYCGQTAGCMKMPLGMKADLSPGDFVFDGDPDPHPKKGVKPQFSDHVYLW